MYARDTTVFSILLGLGLVLEAMSADFEWGWNFDNLGSGGVDSGLTATDWSTTTLTNLGWIIEKTGNQSVVAVDPAGGILKAYVQDSGSAQSRIRALLPFGQEVRQGTVSTTMRTTIGNSVMGVGFWLANVSEGTVTKLAGVWIPNSAATSVSSFQTSVDTDFQTAAGLGLGEDLGSDHLFEIAWDEQGVDLSVVRNADQITLGVYDKPWMVPLALTPNAILIERPTAWNSTAARGLYLNDLRIAGVPEEPEDDDGDGYSNAQERLVGTLAGDPSSFPRLSISQRDQAFRLVFSPSPPRPVRQHRFLQSNDLVDASWAPLAADASDNGTEIEVVVSNAAQRAFQKVEIAWSPSNLVAFARDDYRDWLAGVPTDAGATAAWVVEANALNSVDPFTHGALMYNLARAWYHHGQPESKDAFARLFDLAYAQGYRAGGTRVTWYNARNYCKALGLMVGSLDASRRQQAAEFLFWNGDMATRFARDLAAGGGEDTDFLYTDLFGAFGGVLYHGDQSQVETNVCNLKRWLDIILLPSPGTTDFIKPDGVSFHHWTHYNAYMYAFSTFTDHLYLLIDTPYQISKASYLRFRNAAYAMLLMCNGNHYAPTLAGRHPHSTDLPMSADAYRKLTLIGGDILGTGLADPFLARAYNRIWPGDAELSGYGAESFPTGFWQFNYSPIGVYRHADWVATVKGSNKSFWGSEIYVDANRYGRYQGYGVVEIMYPGGRPASGFQRNGWDWNRPSGGTTIILPWSQLISGRADISSQRDFAGALAAQLRPDGLNGIEGEFGLYGLDFQEMSTLNPSFVFKKSVFCIDGKIICLGSGITNSVSAYPTATTLFQGALAFPSQPIVINGESITTFPDTRSLASNAVHTLIDAHGTGYVTVNGPAITIRRSNQASPSQNGDGSTTYADFATAWFEHGNAPSGAGYEYVIVPGTTPGDLAAQAADVQNGTLYSVLQKDGRMHVLHYLPRDAYGYVVFASTTDLPDLPGPLRRVDAKCLLMVQPDGEQLRLTVANPVLGIASRSYAPSVPKTIRVTVEGEWAFSSHRSARIQSAAGGITVLDIYMVDGLPVETVLKQ
jgi:hypothetical protein